MNAWYDRFPKPLRVFLRRKLKPKVVNMRGCNLSTDKADVPNQVRGMIYRESYEDTERALIDRHLQDDDRVLELGGGVGFISISCAQKCGVENVLTFEANERACKLIEKNYALNNMTPNLSRHAIATHDGELTFNIHDNIISSSFEERKGTQATTVPCRDIRGVMSEFNPTVVVMDIEGAEESVLPLTATPNVRAMLVEVHPNILGETKVNELVNQMNDLGYAITDRVGSKIVLFERSA